MGWSIGFDTKWDRDIGYGVPAYCDHPDCDEVIDRGLAHVCAEQMPYGGENGCGLYFCGAHLTWSDRLECLACEKCDEGKGEQFEPKPDHPDWINHKATDPSWAGWRAEQAA